MADLSVATPEAAAAEPARRRRWPVIALVVAVAVAMIAGFGWRVLGEHPAIGGGSVTGIGQSGVATANDGVSDTKYVLHMVPGRDYVVYISIRNTGRFPFTVTGLAHGQIALYNPESSATFAVQPAAGGAAFTQPFSATVTLNPGREAAVRLVLRTDKCWPMSDSAYGVFTQLPLRVRQFRVTTTQHVPLLSLPLYATTTCTPTALPSPGNYLGTPAWHCRRP